ncbi:uncharacterized protein LOC124159565 isoform X2 [Ischnura elegans]|uniref:uncharacterized protein LOC124159565 isoform X2 n=1 Tax=Ischnura elegans TaxID=197161 RepID=UPI001ED88F81|nr:uncharacterized protein LOC124159565 isoform X2 [Ischnura elegans]
MKMNSKIEELDGEFRLMGQKINSFLEQSLKTNHEKKRLKLWSDKLLLENKNDETTKMNRNHYARYMVDFICKKGTIPGLCHKEPPEGNLPPLGQLLKEESSTGGSPFIERREEKLKNFTREAGCLGKAAYDEAYAVMKRYKQQLDDQMRGKLKKLETKASAVIDNQLQCYNSETIRLREYLKDHEKEIMDLIPHFKWSEYRERQDVYVKEILQKCPQKSPENDSDCTSRMMEDQAENLFLEDKLNAIRHEVAMESDELEKILDENDCLLKSVNDLQKRIDHLGDIMNSLISDLEECSGGDEY